MAEKIGRFQIQSQLAQSPFATVYKALDGESQQTVALKVVHLERVKDRATLTKSVFEEAEQAKSLSSHNIAGLYGVGDEGDLLLAAMEYVQGNSVATTLARHDGFSIWDLQDIARQVCHALDHAHVHNVVHRSLEPAKIMVQWDGMVKILAFGTSAMNSQTIELAGAVPEVLHYASPEQLRGETCDHRSALFSLGAVLYEMATEQRAFAGETADQVRNAILESTPPLPHRLKPNVNQALSALIMKALAKSPQERYQSGQELVHDLEQCKAGSNALGAQTAPSPTPKAAPSKAAAAAAGVGRGASTSTAPVAKMSAAPAVKPAKPNFSVDPMMAETEDSAAPATSFSEISELPPLKEVYVSSPEPAVEEQPEFIEPVAKPTAIEPAVAKPKIQMRQAAGKAVHAIRRTPPKLYLYSVGCAVFLIALYLAGMALYNHFQEGDSGSMTAAPVAPPATQQQPAPAPQNPPAAASTEQPQTNQQDTNQPDTATEGQATSNPAAGRISRGRRSRAPAVAAVVPAQLSISSAPAGADISFDGAALCQTPCTLTGIAPGQHTIIASKPGYATVNRNLAMLSGANSSVSLELGSLAATLSVTSTPAGAVILLDGKDTGKLTPSQLTLNKSGTHTVTLQRAGYLDSSSSVSIATGQASTVNLTLTHLGNTDEIRSAGGHFKKVFGGNNGAGMGVVSIKTQPKGAQIMVNNRVLDKTSPFDFYLNPGTYVVDITMSGYQPLHRVISLQEGEKLAIQETLSPQ
jgi:serine/threonine protein kinase